MKCDSIVYTFRGEITKRVDFKYSFISRFDRKSGFYVRSGVIKNGVETKEDPFMASYPHLIDVGVMGHCIHGKSGLCNSAGIQCYQSGFIVSKENMSLDNFEKICIESEGLVDQIALGGRGDPDCHEYFEDLLKICSKYHIIPNYTTSWLLINEEKAIITKKYCGAVAVSWYRSNYTIKAINTFIKNGVKTNIHYVIDNISIKEAILRLKNNDFPSGINAVIFLLFKPVGQGKEEKMLNCNQKELIEFFNECSKVHPFRIGFDSCFVPGVLKYMPNVIEHSLDTCEGGRFSMYISSDMIALPCSFDQGMKYAFDINNANIYDAWNSRQFEDFRNILRKSCPNCSMRKSCMGGCPLKKSIVLCDLKNNEEEENEN